jgi:hypothetical protein
MPSLQRMLFPAASPNALLQPLRYIMYILVLQMRKQTSQIPLDLCVYDSDRQPFVNTTCTLTHHCVVFSAGDLEGVSSLLAGSDIQLAGGSGPVAAAHWADSHGRWAVHYRRAG